MQLLPYDTFTLQTQEPLSDVIKRLNTQIEAPKTFRWALSGNHAAYEGTLSSSGFEIRRIIHYRNSFLPNIRGRFESSAEGTLIRVTMKLHPFVTIFLIFWCSVWYTGTIPICLFGALSGDMPVFVALLFLGLPIAMLFAFWCAFWYEANRSRRELAQIIRGELLEPQSSGNLARRAFIIGFCILGLAANVLWLTGNQDLFPSIREGSQSLESKYCSQDSTQSPYCKLSVVRTLAGHATVSTLAISADGQTLVSGGQDKAIKVWDLPTGQLRKTLQSDSGEIQALAIAPDGKTVVSGSGDRRVRIWNLTSNQRPQILKGHSSDIRQVEISADGKTIISSTYNEIKVWELATGQLKATLPNLPTAEVEIGLVSVKSEPPQFYPLALSPDGKTALVELGSKLVAWDLKTNQQKVLQTKWSDYFENINSARISLDGQTVVTTSYRQPVTYVKVWDLTTGTLKVQGHVSSFPEQRGLSDIALSHNSASAAAKADHMIGSTPKGLTVWNLQTAELEAILDKEKMSNLVISSDGKVLAGITGDPYYRDTQIKVLQRP